MDVVAGSVKHIMARFKDRITLCMPMMQARAGRVCVRLRVVTTDSIRFVCACIIYHEAVGRNVGCRDVRSDEPGRATAHAVTVELFVY